MKKIKVAQILTLIDSHGEYGGPITVARSLQKASHYSIFQSFLVGGSRESKESSNRRNEKVIPVKAFSSVFSISSLFSFKLLAEIVVRIRNSDIVHLHFARDAIQILSAIVSLIFKKPFVLQTHGMIQKKDNLLVSFFDFVAIKPILRKAKFCFVLTEEELKGLKVIEKKINAVILRNGLDFRRLLENPKSNPEKVNIVFCSRLHINKSVMMFCELAKFYANDDRYSFAIYGPDGGELARVQDFLSKNSLRNCTYKGAQTPTQVQRILSSADLLVLPSKYDPYPMIVLEALSFGTPVLISSFCGQSPIISKIDHKYVFVGKNSNSLISAFIELNPGKINYEFRKFNRNRFMDDFGIVQVWERLEKYYMRSLD